MDIDALENLNAQQREAVLHFDSPLLIVAGAGSGKTRVIIHKIAYLVMQKKIAPFNILGVTFTNRAADEMKTRIEAQTGIASRCFHISTFHSLGLRILRESGKVFGTGPEWKVIDDEEQRKTIERLAKNQFPHFTSDLRDGVIHKINMAKMNLLYPNNPEALRMRGWGEDEIDLFAQYYDFQKSQHVWDYEDLISLPVRRFQDMEPIAQKYRERFRYILIDEFQDINPNQYELIRMIARGCCNVTAVGDDDQAIYSWRGASVRFLFDFERDFPGTHIIKLEQNYRSSKTILDFANHLISFNMYRKGKKMWSESAGGFRVFKLESFSKEDEAEKIAAFVDVLKRKSPDLFPLAVLYRINSQSLQIETALVKRRIPFKIIKGLRFFDRKEIKDCLALLRLVFNPDDDLAFVRMVDFLPVGIGEKTVRQLTQFCQEHNVSLFYALEEELPEKFARQPIFPLIRELSGQSQKLPFSTILENLLEISGYRAILTEKEETERLFNIAELRDFLEKWQVENPETSFSELLDRMSVETPTRSDEMKEKVFLLTMHNAKGLEFQTVMVAGINATYMPFFLRKNREEIEEERRLFYVACTRAMKLLVVSSGSDRQSIFMQTANSSLFCRVDLPEDIVDIIAPSIENEETNLESHFLLHPQFGKGRIIEEVSSGKYLVHFSDRGKKVIDTSVVSVDFM